MNAEKDTVKTKLRREDQVIVIAGKDKGKTGRVLRIDRLKGRVLVEGINLVKKAMRRKNDQDRGGIIELEASIAISNVMYVDKAGKPTRLRYVSENGAKKRQCVRSGEVIQ